MKDFPVLSLSNQQPPEVWWSIDPGDVHVGLAQWSYSDLVSVFETDPYTLLSMLSAGPPKFVICERWALYGWKASEQTGSEFFTSQLVGAIKCLCWLRQVPLLMQQPSVGKAMFRPERHKDRVWRGRNKHQRDAEAHGLAWLAKLDRISEGYGG